jgi:hypothetical protein
MFVESQALPPLTQYPDTSRDARRLLADPIIMQMISDHNYELEILDRFIVQNYDVMSKND